MLIDEVTITIAAGNGGDGSVHFRREKYIAKGGPDGGNGGCGGSVYFIGVRDITSLRQFRYKKKIQADSGINGSGKKKHGRNAKNLIIPIPQATIITDTETKESFEIALDQKVLIAKGGIGGKGNWEFRSATNQTPRTAEKGTSGEIKKLKLDLQLIAEIGLIGLPNVGKSSLLNELTSAKAKTANYPFTTLEPNLGDMHGVIIADIPGLIENAHKGKGLGFKFLKHIAKTKVLVFCVSCESDDVIRDYKTVKKEISQYNLQLLRKTSLILLTKSDLVGQRELQKKLKKLKKLTRRVLPTSIYDPDAIDTIKQTFRKNF